MKLSLKALRAYVDFSGSGEELAAVLADLGFPNDGITHLGEGLDQVCVGKILKKSKHPQADRLSLLQVTLGQEPLAIVCGASNMVEGDFVALAPVGARIPGKDGAGMVMKESKIRGETSQGMCCSLAELRLSDEAEGIWILNSQVKESDLGKKVSEVVEAEDWVLEIDVTPNRGDCLSIRGLAREVGAKLGLKLKSTPSLKWKTPSPYVNPSIESFEDSAGFAGCLVQGVSVGKSPASLAEFLQKMGARSISNLVDVTNAVLFELGHPIHFFDADKIDPKTIGVRRARQGETLTLLNDQTIKLHPEDLVIADATGPLSLAGIMGGLPSSVTESTKNILIEAASFKPALIRATARRHGLSSESSYRFERGVTAHRLDEVIERTLAWLKDVSGFETASGAKVVDRNLSLKSVLWDRKRVEAKLGKLEKSDDEIFELLRRLDYGFEPKGSTARMVFPWYRTDTSFLEDAMEDIARLLGYEALEKRRLLAAESVSSIRDLRPTMKFKDHFIESFVHCGFCEVVHMSFSNADDEARLRLNLGPAVELQNPIHSEKAILRRSLLPQLLSRARYNSFHGELGIRLVEAGPVFRADLASLYDESPCSENLAGAVVWLPRPQDKKKMWAHQGLAPFFEFKGVLESVMRGMKFRRSQISIESLLHPNRRFQIGNSWAGELHPLYVKAFDLPGAAYVCEWILEGQERGWKMNQPALYPSVDFDLSLVVAKKVSCEAIISTVLKKKEPLLEDIKAYDFFEGAQIGKDKKSMTFALRYRASSKTLTLDEAKKAHDTLVEALLKAFPSGDVAVR